MLVLFETPAGYAIFKLLDEKKLHKADNLYKDFETPEAASKVVKLKHFEKFLDTTEALAATTAAVEGKMSKSLKKMLKKLVVKEAQEQLLVADAKLGNAIKDKLNLQCCTNTNVQELMRCIRSQMDGLLAGLPKKEMTAMALGLAHSLSRYKLKFSPDKVDTMIIQAVCLLDDLDKELNNYIMRCREWYGWHFPELSKLISDHVVYVKVVKIIGTRENAANTDMSDVLTQDMEEKVKEAAEISMGTEITDDDIGNIQHLCDQVVQISSYRTQLYDYLKSRMMAIAPNLTVLVGELVGARLISHAGSLLNLAKHPASTVQILGAEKALFRALKSKRDTPKYGLIYHAQLVTQSSVKNKGKASRMLAAKAALATRVDALGEENSFELGVEHKARLEVRMRMLEEGQNRRISGTAKAKAKFQKYQGKSEVRQYQPGADSTVPSSGKRKRSGEDWEDKKPLIEELPSFDQQEGTSQPKKKKKIKHEVKQEDEEDGDMYAAGGSFVEVKQEEDHYESFGAEDGEGSPKKKKKKKTKVEVKQEYEAEEQEEVAEPEKKKKKKKKSVCEEEEAEAAGEESFVGSFEEGGSEKKKKKKKKSKGGFEDQ